MTTFNKTIFVIGAGAHVPYGMPTGMQLSDEIKALHSSQTKHKITMVREGFDPTKSNSVNWANELAWILRDLEIVEKPDQRTPGNAYDLKIGRAIDYAISCFAKSGMYTIDSYLSCKASQEKKHPFNVTEILKVAMLFVLAKKQDASQLGFRKSDWIEFLINEFMSKDRLISKFLERPPKIYTFNYDTVLEKLIEGHLTEFHGIPKEKALQAIEKIGIKHIYGGFDFKHTGSIANRIGNALPSIRLVGNDRESSVFDPITSSFSTDICKVRDVIFLGFGFDEKNCDILLSSQTLRTLDEKAAFLRISSTGMGIDDSFIEEVSVRFERKIAILKDVDCMGILKGDLKLFTL